MVVTIAFKMVEAHGKLSLQNLVNLRGKKRTGALGIGADGTNTGPQRTTKKCRMKNDATTNKTDSTELSNKKSLTINLAYLKSDSITDDIFGMTVSAETNYHVASDEIEIIFDINSNHCKEVKHSTSDDSEQLKD